LIVITTITINMTRLVNFRMVLTPFKDDLEPQINKNPHSG